MDKKDQQIWVVVVIIAIIGFIAYANISDRRHDWRNYDWPVSKDQRDYNAARAAGAAYIRNLGK